jgi:hypothetical protein
MPTNLSKGEGKMEQKGQGNGAGKLSRRDFIKSAGLLVGGAAAGAAAGAGITSSLAPEATGGGGGAAVQSAPETIEVIKEVPVATTGVLPSALEPETTKVVQIQHLIAFDMKNGKIVRGRRVHFAEDYPEIKPWTISARGKTWTVPVKSPAPAYYLAHRKRTDSPNRVLYPMKRVDWEPGGDPEKINAQNRGIS